MILYYCYYILILIEGPYLAGTVFCTHLCFGLPSKHYKVLTLGGGFWIFGNLGPRIYISEFLDGKLIIKEMLLYTICNILKRISVKKKKNKEKKHTNKK